MAAIVSEAKESVKGEEMMSSPAESKADPESQGLLDLDASVCSNDSKALAKRSWWLELLDMDPYSHVRWDSTTVTKSVKSWKPSLTSLSSRV